MCAIFGEGHLRVVKGVGGVGDTKGEQGRTKRKMVGSGGGIISRVCGLPSGSAARLGVKRVGVAGWEVMGWVVGVGGTVVVTDTLSTDRQTDREWITRTHTETHTHIYTQNAIIYSMQ